MGELTAKTFNIRRPDVDIYALRIGNVIEPHEYAQNFPGYMKDPACRKRNAWSYIDARDLGQICHLCIEKSGLGFQVSEACLPSYCQTSLILTLFDFIAGLQRDQRYHHHPRADQRSPTKVLPECQGHPRDGRVRGALVEQEDQGGIRVQGRAQLARLCRCREAQGRVVLSGTSGGSARNVAEVPDQMIMKQSSLESIYLIEESRCLVVCPQRNHTWHRTSSNLFCHPWRYRGRYNRCHDRFLPFKIPTVSNTNC